MGEVIAFKPGRKKKKGDTLCREGHHKWQIDQSKQFDPRSGKLVTIYQCARCKKRKTRLL